MTTPHELLDTVVIPSGLSLLKYCLVTKYALGWVLLTSVAEGRHYKFRSDPLGTLLVVY